MFNIEDQIGFNLYKVSLLFRRELVKCLNEYDITPEQWQILAILWKNESLKQTQIMELTLQDAPTVSRMLNLLKKKGLVLANKSSKDKRETLITVTQKGSKLKDIIPKKVMKHFNPILNKVSNDRKEIFTDILLEFQLLLK